jgi:hypothetical protein
MRTDLPLLGSNTPNEIEASSIAPAFGNYDAT